MGAAARLVAACIQDSKMTVDKTSLGEIEAAARAVAPYVLRTPQRVAPGLSARLGCDVQLKLEMRQHSGSFKTRGAFHQMLALGDAALSRGVVAVSGGNFARAVAYCSGILGVDAILCMPENAPAGSIEVTRGYGARVELLPDAVAAFARADDWVARGRTALHPFDNAEQIAGNGLVALEIMQDCPAMTDIIVSIGGGGLIAGVIAAVKAVQPQARVWGVEPDTAPTMRRALDAGEIVNIKPASLSATLERSLRRAGRAGFVPRAPGRPNPGYRSGDDRGAAVLYQA